jgi:hypothetical protein
MKNRKNSVLVKKKKPKKSQNIKSNTKNKKTRKIRLRGGMENEEPVCPICFEILDGNREEYMLICRIPHGPFHKECMANWCRDKVDNCTCPVCRRNLNDEEMIDIGFSAEIILRRRNNQWIQSYIEYISDKLSMNDIPQIPQELQDSVEIEQYHEGGPVRRFLNIISILVEKLSAELTVCVERGLLQDIYKNAAIEYIYDIAVEIIENIDDDDDIVNYPNDIFYRVIKDIILNIEHEINIREHILNTQMP